MKATDLLEVCDVAQALSEHGYPITQDEFDFNIRRGTGPRTVSLDGKRVVRWVDVTTWADARPTTPAAPTPQQAAVRAEISDKEYLADVLASYLLQHHPSTWKLLCHIEGRPRRDKVNQMTKEVIDTMLKFVKRLPINTNYD